MKYLKYAIAGAIGLALIVIKKSKVEIGMSSPEREDMFNEMSKLGK